MDESRQDQLNEILLQAHRMQEHLGYANATLQEAEVVGTGGDGAVTVTMTAAGEIRAVRIDPRAVDLDHIDRTENMVAEAFIDATNEIRSLTEDLMRPMADGLALFNQPG